MLFALSGCSTARDKPDAPPKSARASVQLPPGEYRGVDDSAGSQSVCEVPDDGPIICRGRERPDEGVYTLRGVPVRSSSLRAPTGRRASRLEASAEYGPVIVVSREEIRIDDGSVVALAGQTERSDIVDELSERLRDSDGRPLLVADESVSYRTISHVGIALSSTGAGPMDLAVARSSSAVHLSCERAEGEAADDSSGGRWRCSAYRTPSSENDEPVRFVDVGVVPLASSASAGYCEASDIQNTVGDTAPDLEACWREWMKRRDLGEDEASAKLLVQWKVRLDGTTDDINVRRSTAGDDSFEACIRDVVSQMEFQQPEGGICVVDYPFHFRPK